MKTVVCLLLLLPVFVFAQGQIIFQNSAATAITNWQTGQRADISTMVGLYANQNPSAYMWDPGWVLTARTNLTVPGIFLGGIVTLPPGYSDRPIAVQVRAWLSSSYDSFEAAAAAGDWRGGISIVMVMTPSTPPAPPPTLLQSGFQPFKINILIPEPTTLALAGLGTVLLAFGKIARRRPPDR